MNDNKDQKENEEQKDKSSLIVNKLVVPILIAFMAGGTSPWWVSLFQGNGEVGKPIAPTKTEGANAQSKGDQTPVNGMGNNVVQGTSNNVVQGTGNNVVQGTGNQLTIQQESDAKSRGEFKIPAISGLSYRKARKILVEEGWIPRTQRHFYSQEERSLQSGSGKVFWNLGYWEVVSCTGTAEGFCRFEFSDPSGRKLVVITAGMEDPSIPVQARVNRVFFEKENSP
jgi:hypothetical protein